MNCSTCGAQIPDNEKRCPRCGTYVVSTEQQANTEAPPAGNGFSHGTPPQVNSPKMEGQADFYAPNQSGAAGTPPPVYEAPPVQQETVLPRTSPESGYPYGTQPGMSPPAVPYGYAAASVKKKSEHTCGFPSLQSSLLCLRPVPSWSII